MILLHYHLFKNAGTSVDAMLKANFGEAWVEQEFETRGSESNCDAVRQFLVERPHIKALSSHTALMPVPEIESVEIFPILFVRHPILRLKSAYAFESKQDADTHGARLARSTDFSGYISAMLEQENATQAWNFQTTRLAYCHCGGSDVPLERAQNALRQLPFVGLVEEYVLSIDILVAKLKPHIHDFEPLLARKNATSDGSESVTARIAAIQTELGDALFERLVRANFADLAIYYTIADRYLKIAAEQKTDSG
ncbi:sulfotransferase family 2 domain-containing protein [Parasphingopyxis sp.]|uniref:sulfotransferase family 2 domain-containing protein n=1 Tax=Parasphingopyxis sp. TaxID=1920299 RepID=UPI002633A4F7|nr:sulfotransferase family 2 domain-containing protein [Parasphingopyxis sp.]